MTKKCSGCGSVLQCTDPMRVGYIPREKKDNGVCVRCYKIRHYNQADLVSIPRGNDEVLEVVNKSLDFVVFMVDFININEDVINTYKKIKNDKLLVISKSDIIPKSIKRSTIINWLESCYGVSENILFLSTKKKLNINFLDKLFLKHRIIYLLGFTNAGKSTLVNDYISDKLDKELIMTTSMIPNTTLDFNEIKFDGVKLIDSPGFTYDLTFYESNEVDLIKKMDSKKFISPITHQVKDITYLNLEDRFIISSNINNSLTFYMSNFLELKKIYNVDNYDYKKIIINVADNSDVVIKGIGFINVKKACELSILSNYSELIEVRESMFYE